MSAVINNSDVIKRPCKVIEIDETVTKSVLRRTVTNHRIEDETTGKTYKITRTKNGLLMTGT